MLILLVDDDAEDCTIFKEALKEVNPNSVCLTVHNGEEALRLLDDSILLPDMVFLDINMPFMNGKICLVKIRENEKLRELPVVIYSTTITPGEKKAFAKLGAGIFEKPATFLHLKETLKKFLFSRPG